MRSKRLGVETGFLVPLREDKTIGNGKLHPVNRWQWLGRVLRESYGGFTVMTAPLSGIYVDPDTGQSVSDESREYRIAISRRSVAKLRQFLGREVASVFVQKYIYFVVGIDAELVENANL